MTQPTNTYSTYGATGSNREDLHNVIFDISPTETPVISMAAQGTAENTLHEWLTDALDAPDGTNARIEGDDKVAQAVTTPSRLQNYTQISDKTVILSGTQQAMNGVNGQNTIGRAVARKGQALKRDMEVIITGNQAPAAGDNATARRLRSLCAWYVTANSNRGASGAAGTTTQAATDATTGDMRPLRETFVKDVLQKVWNAGGEPDTIVLSGTNKQKFSGFSGNANRNVDASTKKLMASVNVYESDFGDLSIMPDRFSRTRDLHVLQSDMISIDFLRRMDTEDLAKTGDADKKLIICEYTLRMNNPLAHGVVADLTP